MAAASSTRINFADVEDQKEFSVLPTGKYTLQISDLTEREAGDQAKNPGARILRWEFTVVNDEDYANRKVWDNQACVKDSLWKVKALLKAAGFDVSSLGYDPETKEFDQDGEPLDMSDIVGETIVGSIGIRPANKDKNTGKDYPQQNRINQFYPYEEDDADLLG